MTFEQIQKANETIKTTDVKGKAYAEVNQRIKAFRMVYPAGSIETDILYLDDGVVTMKAVVKDENGTVIGTGLAQEKEQSSYINKTSFIENCETSAVGRALGMCGFGIDTSVASADELQNALLNQSGGEDEDIFDTKASASQRKMICKLAEEAWGEKWKDKLTLIIAKYGAESTADLKYLDAEKVIKELKEQ